jgi:hypothetical protein
MSDDIRTTIIVTARRVDGPGPQWQFGATVHAYSATNENGSGGNLVGSHTLTTENALENAISDLDSNDRIIIKVPGMPSVVMMGERQTVFFNHHLR